MIMTSLFYLIVFSAAVFSKSISTIVSISKQNRWAYLSKFNLGPEIGYWQLRAKLVNPLPSDMISLEVMTHIDYEWDSINQLAFCQHYDKEEAREKTFNLPSNGDWTNFIQGELARNIFPHTWFFTVSSCNSTLQGKYKIKVELGIQTESGSHISYESYFLTYLYPAAGVLFAIAFIQCFINLQNYLQQTDKIEKKLFLLCLTVGIELLGIVSELIHLWLYSNNGFGLEILSLFSQFCEFLSQLLFITLLILIATGWGVRHDEFPDSETFLPIGMLMLFVHIVIIGYSKAHNEDPGKISIYDGMPGTILFIFRLSFWIFFLYCAANLYQQVKANTRAFLISFIIFGSIYFISVPLFVLMSWQIPKYHRWFFIISSTLFTHFMGYLVIMCQFSSKGSYYKISNLSSNVLPGKDL